jgi:hypothetical protein
MPVTADKSSGNVWKITGTTTTAQTIHTGPVWVKKITWRAPATSNDDLEIVDSLGATIVDFDAVVTGDAGDVSWDSFSERPYTGLIVNIMDSGTVYIHIG